jgi:hypothetical protein
LRQEPIQIKNDRRQQKRGYTSTLRSTLSTAMPVVSENSILADSRNEENSTGWVGGKYISTYSDGYGGTTGTIGNKRITTYEDGYGNTHRYHRQRSNKCLHRPFRHHYRDNRPAASELLY